MTTSPSDRLFGLALRATTLGDLLRDLAQRDGCCVEGIAGMAHPQGGPRSRRVVRTGTDGITRHAVLPNMDDRDLITVLVIRSICRRLGLDAARYGG